MMTHDHSTTPMTIGQNSGRTGPYRADETGADVHLKEVRDFVRHGASQTWRLGDSNP